MVNEHSESAQEKEPSATTTLSSAAAEETQQQSFNRPLRWFKIICGVASAAGFGYGLRTAWIQSRVLKLGELPKAVMLPAAGFAMQAFGLATLITVSGYVTLLVLISEAMGINTFKEFGHKTKRAFGDRFRISKREDGGENYETLRELFEAVQSQKEKRKEKE